eukprot:CAMPEP_0174251130 /NCGR_PEP_ID=MMETSP0439-20130205/1059_1 /TAXON_ID=0 /ORGANISM="Stereomyxa ramosa, Strain Chinc5" /LENGTH=592 /DNA_ID=CAMNT_0015331371 /DNA_START=14 /DNA_END=1789 /DNA_ORIENTATION=+
MSDLDDDFEGKGGGWVLVDDRAQKSKKIEQRKNKRKRRQKAAKKLENRYSPEEYQQSFSGMVEPPKKKDVQEKPAVPKKVRLREEHKMESDTLFSIFDEIQTEKMQKKRMANQPQNTEVAKKKKKKKTKKPTMASVSAQLDKEELKKFVEELPSKYIGNYDPQTKVLTDYFEKIFGKIEPPKNLSERTYLDQIKFPHYYLEDKSYYAPVLKYMRELPEKESIIFLSFLLSELAHIEKRNGTEFNTSGLGVKLLTQIICIHLPEILVKVFATPDFQSRHFNLSPKPRRADKERLLLVNPPSCSILCWAIGQSVEGRRSISFSLWCEYLFPSLCCDAANESARTQVLAFLDCMMDLHKSVAMRKTKMDNSIKITALERLLNYHLYTKNAKKGELFDTMTRLTIWAAYNSPRIYFELLLKLYLEDKKHLIEEMLVMSLAKDKVCFDVWEANYVKYVDQSNDLLTYICEHWEELPEEGRKVGVDKQRLFTFVEAVPDLLEEAGASEQTQDEMDSTCDQLRRFLARHVKVTPSKKAELKRLPKQKASGGGGLSVSFIIFALFLIPFCVLILTATCVYDRCTVEYCDKVCRQLEPLNW